MRSGVAFALAVAFVAFGAHATPPQLGATGTLPGPSPVSPLQHIIYTIDEIDVSDSLPVPVLKELGPATSMAQVKSILGKYRIGFREGIRNVDSRTLDTRQAGMLASLPPREVFAYRRGRDWRFNVIVGRHPAELTS